MADYILYSAIFDIDCISFYLLNQRRAYSLFGGYKCLTIRLQRW